MKSIEFGEEGLKDPKALAAQLFADETDPTSPFYVRHLVRPEIHWIRILLFTLVPAAAFAALFLLLRSTFMNTTAAALTAAACALVYLIVMAKRAAICAVRIYQRYAPDSIRNKCRFEPSCSEYMILAIEKYGFLKGTLKGINRLRRCRPGGGGYDYP